MHKNASDPVPLGEHDMVCPECGEVFDMRDLVMAFFHGLGHDPALIDEEATTTPLGYEVFDEEESAS
jgi:hypothetical protein